MTNSVLKMREIVNGLSAAGCRQPYKCMSFLESILGV